MKAYNFAAGSLLTFSILLSGLTARADEGMWTMDHLPLDQLKKTYGFTPTAEWINRVTQASARLALGCSASFVSADGLVMTNHHCANECLEQLSDKRHDYFTNGYKAPNGQTSEPKCPAMELDGLNRITDVTDQMDKALAGKQGADFTHAQQAAEAAIEKDCVAGDPTRWRCDVVALYHGGRTALYRYRRYQDVRLVMAPDQNAAFFGGDPDNFNFPRYDLDMAFLRAYDSGKPAKTTYFQFDPNGPKEGQLVFTSGNPGSTSREESVAELSFERDVMVPFIIGYYSTFDGALWQLGRQSASNRQDAQDELFGIENGLKVYTGRVETLASPAMLAAKKIFEQGLKDWINSDPTRKSAYGDPWTKIDRALAIERDIYIPYVMLEGRRAPMGFQGDLFSFAKTLVRGASERDKPDAERLTGWRDANIPAIEAHLASTAPIHPALDETMLALSLTKMRQALGADNDTVHLVLGHESPEQLAARVVHQSKLGDPNIRMTLWKGGSKAIAASDDPMIVLARTIEPAARALRDRMDNDVHAPMRQAAEAIARARFARDGANTYPDATFTQRVSYGVVKGWKEHGHNVPAFTDIAGLYKRASGADPFRLTKAWQDAQGRINPNTPFDFVTTNDIIGGNSGSPVIDAQGHALGLIFDGNIHSLGGNYTYDATNNRAVAVDTAAIIEALKVVYNNQALADELTVGHLK